MILSIFLLSSHLRDLLVFGCDDDALCLKRVIVERVRHCRDDAHFVEAQVHDLFDIGFRLFDPVAAGKARIVRTKLEQFADILRFHHFRFQIALIDDGAVRALGQIDFDARAA